MLSNATTTGASGAIALSRAIHTFQAHGTTTAGDGSAAIAIQVSNNGDDWLTVGTISLPLTTVSSSDGLVMEAPWKFVRANVTAISGTGASVTVTMGV